MTLYTTNFDGVTAPAQPSGFGYSSATIVTTTLQKVSSPNSLTQIVGTGSLEFVIDQTPVSLASGGRHYVDVALDSDSVTGYMFASGNDPASYLAAYGVEFNVTDANPSNYGFYIVKRSGGANSRLTSRVPPDSLAADTFYRLGLDPTPGALKLSIQRLSDGFYARADGTFASGAFDCLTSNDSTITPPATNYRALAFFKQVATSGTKNLYFDDWAYDQGTPPRSPETFYLSTGGNDSNDGLTPATAWQTLAKATSGPSGGYVNGDVLVLAAGQTFTAGAGTGCLTFTKQVSVQGATATTTKSQWPTLNAGDYWGIRYHDTAPGSVQYLNLVGSGFNPATGVGTNGGAGSQPTYPAVDGAGIDLWSDTSTGTPYTTSGVIRYIQISGFYWGIALRAEPATSGQNADGFNLVSITNYLIYDCLQSAISSYGGNSNNKSGSPFNFYVGDRPHTGLYLADGESYNIFGDPNATVWSGVVHQVNNVAYGLGERLYGHDSVKLLAANTVGSYSSGGGGGFICLGCTGFTWQDAEACRMTTVLAYDSCGFDIDGDCQNCLIQRCYSHDNYGAGYQTGVYPSTGPTVTSTNNTIRYSVSANDCQNPQLQLSNSIPQAALADFGSGTGSTNGTLFYGMSVWLGSGPASLKPSGFARINAGSSTNARVYNSIFYASTAGNAFVYMNSTTAGPALIGNTYYYAPGTGSPLWHMGGVSYASLAAIQSAGYESFNGASTGSAQNPLFQNAGFHADLGAGRLPRTSLTAYDLKAGSPSYTSGANLLALLPSLATTATPDLRLTLRPGSSPMAAGASAPSANSGDTIGGGGSGSGSRNIIGY